ELLAGGCKLAGAGEIAHEGVFQHVVGGLELQRPLEEEHERAPAVRLGRRGLGDGDQLAEAALEDRLDERFARAEVAVERADADPGPPRDLLERRLDASLGEDLARSRDEELVVPPRMAAQALLLAGDLGHGITLARNRRHSSGFCYRPENERYEPR